MKNITEKDKIISEHELISLIINELYARNLTDYVDKIEIGNNLPVARYYNSSKILCFNYDMMLSQIMFNANKIHLNSNLELIRYINLNILSTVLHEIIHVAQEKEKNDLVLLSEEVETTLKEQKKYDVTYYLTNPIERQAQISSLSYVVMLNNELNNSTTIILLKRRLANCIEFGYEKERYPIQIFFQGTKYFEEAINYSKTIPRTFEERLEYGCELSNIEFNKIKELKL